MSSSGLVGRRKTVIGLASATQAASGGMLGTALVVYVGRDGSPLAVSMLATIFFTSSMIFSPLWGGIGDLLGRRRDLLLGLSALTTLVTAGFLVIDSIWGQIGLRGFRAVFAVGFGPVVLSIVSGLAGRTHRGRSVGFVSSASAVGDVGAQLTVSALLSALASTSVFFVIGTLSALTTVLLFFFDDPAESTDSSPSVGELLTSVRTRLVPDRDERARLRQTGLTWLYAGIALRHTAVQGVGSLVPIYLVGELGLPLSLMGGILAIGPAAQIGFMPLCGRLADRGSRKQLIVGGIVLSATYTLVLAGAVVFSRPVLRAATAGVAFIVIAAGFSAMDVGTVSIIGDSVPSSRESAFVGLRSTAAGAGGIVGPLLVGITATLIGFAAAFVIASTFAFAATAVVLTKLEEPSRTTAPTTELLTVETSTGIVQRPGMHRGEDGD
ncbi:MFS transporter [Halovenus marina]|uniref:MFS transporter n=1 Tax=Halovenus marina TaxID=3396621 RepID=UPI003F551B60